LPLVLDLVQECLTNTQDVGGLWQVEGGRVLEAGERVGDFSTVRRVSCGTEEQNTAMVWMTVFFLDERPPQNITLHGSHNFNSGEEIGSVSAASAAYATLIAKQFRRVPSSAKLSTLTIG